MKRLLNKMRKFFGSKIFNTLNLPSKKFVIIEGKKGFHSEVKFSGNHLFGILPLFKVARFEEFLWDNFISERFQKMNQNLSCFTENFSGKIISFLKKSIGDKIKKTKEKSFASIKQEYSSLHEGFITKVIKQTTNEFRKELLEKLKISGEEIFNSQVQQHLVSIILKMKEEDNKAKSSDIVSVTSGDLALPVGTRFFVQEKNISVYVIEQSPQIRTVTFNFKKEGKRIKYQLAFPFIVFFVTLVNKNFYSLHLFFRKQQLKNYQDNLLCPALSNVYNDFKVCFPAPTSSNGNPVKVVEDAIQSFWGSEFDGDLPNFLISAQSSFSQISSMGKWEEESRNNSHFVLDINWRNANKCVIDVINMAVKAKEQGDQQINSISALEVYVKKLGEKISNEIRESCFFLVPHLSISDKGMDIATKRLKKILFDNCDELVGSLNKDIDETFAPNFIEKKFVSVIQENEAQIKMIIDQAETEIKNVITY